MRRLHPRQSIMLGIAVLLFVLGASRNAAAQGFREAELTQLSFTADGNWLTAAYFYHATNRPGTNWAAWTVIWNTKTTAATLLKDVTLPIVSSPDGKWLALGMCDAKQRYGPQTRLALWKPGEAKPVRIMDTSTAIPKDTYDGGARYFGLGAAAFDPAGKHVIWLEDEGALCLTATDDESSTPIRLDDLKRHIPRAQSGRWGGNRDERGVSLVLDQEGRATAEIPARYYNSGGKEMVQEMVRLEPVLELRF